jgi:hypothetical protein
MPSKIQAIIFNREYFTRKSANAWLKTHKYNPIKPLHTTTNYYRARLIDPSKFNDFRILKFSDRIKAVLGFY